MFIGGRNGLPHLICELFHFWEKKTPKTLQWMANANNQAAWTIKLKKIVRNPPLTL